MLPAKAHRAPGAPVIAARALTLSLIAGLALAAAGCGDEEDDAAAPDSGGATDITITLDADGPGGEPPKSESVSCEAGADDSPCATLTAADVAPVSADMACTEIYGGPDEATIEGTIAGEPVSATLTRGNGCEIERFDRFTPLIQELFPGYTPGASLAP